MTTIAIERELLEQALEVIFANTVGAEEIEDAIRAALSAPATAPTQPAFESWCASMGFIPTQARYETWQAATDAAINKICADVQAAGFANGGIETPADVAPEILFQLKEKIEAATAAALAAPATAPEKTVKEIMEFARHYAADTFSSATLEDKIRRSLAAPATAPAWHGAPTCDGLWFCDEGDENPYRFTCHKILMPLSPYLSGEGERWYGPIPPDGEQS